MWWRDYYNFSVMSHTVTHNSTLVRLSILSTVPVALRKMYDMYDKCMLDLIKTNYGGRVHANGGTCQPVQQCDLLICIKWFLDNIGGL